MSYINSPEEVVEQYNMTTEEVGVFLDRTRNATMPEVVGRSLCKLLGLVRMVPAQIDDLGDMVLDEHGSVHFVPSTNRGRGKGRGAGAVTPAHHVLDARDVVTGFMYDFAAALTAGKEPDLTFGDLKPRQPISREMSGDLVLNVGHGTSRKDIMVPKTAPSKLSLSVVKPDCWFFRRHSVMTLGQSAVQVREVYETPEGLLTIHTAQGWAIRPNLLGNRRPRIDVISETDTSLV